MNDVVRYEREGELALVTIDNPPVNATSQAVRAGLSAAIGRATADDSRAVVILCAGRTFVAGADITEFGKPQQEPQLPDVFDALEAMPKPVIAALHGTALGGGLELAMAAHYRIALRSAKCGLPEVKLGLLPGAGGTRRAPRLMGVKRALDFMVDGQPIAADAAREAGLVDRVVEGELRAAAIGFAREILAGGARPRRSADIVPDLAGIDAAWFAAEKARVAKANRGQPAPAAIVEALELGVTLPAVEAHARTRSLFMALMNGTESKALRHLFFAEREAARLPADARGAGARAIKSVAVIGGGTMGAGIAMNFADNGVPVTLVETDPDAAGRAAARVRQTWEASIKRGRLTPQQLEERFARIRFACDFGALAEADLVVEAVFEDLGVKQEVFRRLDAVAKPGAILATNTSYLDVDAIASVTQRPGDVLGLHYFSPANVMKLLEIVRARRTAPDVVATALELAKRVRKIPALVGVCYGFVGNRMLTPYGREAQFLLLEGATPTQVDGAMERFGMAMGPFAVTDLAGLDIGYKARKARPDRPADPRWFRVGDLLAEQGRLGQKSGAGFHRYDGRQRSPDPEVEAAIRAEAARLGVAQRAITEPEIVERLVYALVNEGCRVLAEGIAQRSSDIDLIFVNGYGFPAARGGPMFYAQGVGLARVLERIRDFRAQLGAEYWEPAALLVKHADSGSALP